MNKRDTRGFTLIEVVLAIAVGLIIIAGVSVGYTYAKRSAILDNQRKNVGAIKTFVEQAVASTQANLAGGSTSLTPPAITNAQLTALADRLPSLKNDPYTGAPRKPAGNAHEACGAGTSCYSAATAQSANASYGPTLTGGTDEVPNTVAGTGGSQFIYVPGGNFKRTFTVTLADGSVRTFYGYVLIESDTDGNIVAADGGDVTTKDIGTGT